MPESCGRDCRQCLTKLCMNKIPVFAALSRPDLEQIARRIVHLQYSKGSVILANGDRADSINIVNTGRIKRNYAV